MRCYEIVRGIGEENKDFTQSCLIKAIVILHVFTVSALHLRAGLRHLTYRPLLGQF